MKILVACECSGEINKAHTDMGHDVLSCDLQPCEGETAREKETRIMFIYTNLQYLYMVKFKRARTIIYSEFEKLPKHQQKSVLKTTNAMFKSKKKGKKRKKSRS